jgi:hypothetical protein
MQEERYKGGREVRIKWKNKWTRQEGEKKLKNENTRKGSQEEKKED